MQNHQLITNQEDQIPTQILKTNRFVKTESKGLNSPSQIVVAATKPSLLKRERKKEKEREREREREKKHLNSLTLCGCPEARKALEGKKKKKKECKFNGFMRIRKVGNLKK